MKPRKIALATVLVVALCCSGFYILGLQNTARKLGASQMNENQVIWIAKQVAVRNGLRPEDYQQPMTTFNAKKKDWWISFEHKPPSYPGSHFTVTIDDRNGKASFFEGM